MKLLKICFFNSCKVWGGGEKWHYEMAENMKKSGHDVTVATSKNSELSLKAKESKLRVEEFEIGNMTFLNLLKMKSLMCFFKEEKYDILILNLPSDLKSAGIACRLSSNAKVVYRRGSAIPIKNSFLNRILFSKVVEYIIANSEETKNTILQKNSGLFDKNKIYVIYNGINIAEYNNREYEKLYENQENEIVIGNAGRLSKQKNQIFLIKLAEYLKESGEKFKIVIAGKGEIEEELKKEVEKRGLTKEVIFVGFIKNIRSFMKSIDIFLLPSHWEGFGYVLVEAMLAEKPVIAFNISSNPEIVEDGKSGFLIEKDSIKECYDKIKKLIENREYCLKMGKYGKISSEKNFSDENSLRKLEEILKKIITAEEK